ncbi:MAG: ribosome biogenesis GTP-binding protein YihA/YsxC [Hyphomonadaceae bacterium]
MSAPDADAIEAGRVLFARPIAFERGVVSLADLPAADRIEIAFAGRSNVGKSSLLNALTNRKNLARASAEPGRTRELNFFLLDDLVRLVDLPGYGYAKAPKSAIARWTALMRDYLRGRAPLQRVLLLVDARHGVKPNDHEVMDALDKAALIYQIVLTKADKLGAPALAACVAETEAAIAKRPAAHPRVIPTSSETGAGIDLLRAEIAALAGFSL